MCVCLLIFLQNKDMYTDNSVLEEKSLNIMLLKYSMGNTTEGESLIISCHVAYCAECKKEIKKY